MAKPRLGLSLRRLFAIFTLAGLLLGGTSFVGTTGASASGPTSRKIPASFVFFRVPPAARGGCGWQIGIEFPSVPGADGYMLNFWDGYYKVVEVKSFSASDLPSDPRLHMPKGVNLFDWTGGYSSSPPCMPPDPTEKGRFSRGAQAWAYFPGKPPKTGTIQGTVTDKDGGPVSGVLINAYGTLGGQADNVSAVTAAGGFYYITVPAGKWRAVPNPASFKKPAFTPTSASLSVPEGGTATANFRLNAGLGLKLSFDQTSVAADGLHVVKGTVTTTQDGKPKGGVGVLLSVMPGHTASAVTTTPRATICSASGRVWPIGSLAYPNPAPVEVVTNAAGTYDLTLTVGTRPGKWTLNSWAYSSGGQLSTDVAAASATKSITITPVAPSTPVHNFVGELNAFKGTSLLKGLTADPVGMSTVLAALTAQGAKKGPSLGSFVYSVAWDASDNAVLLISPAGSAAYISSGKFAPAATIQNDLVIDSVEWTGKGLSSSFTGAASLVSVIQAGLLPDIPTFRQWASGARVKGWGLKKNAMAISTPNLQWWGWAYPGITAPGACY